jgi:hypothetical protein
MHARIRENCVAAVVLAIVALACFHRLTAHPTDVVVGPQRGGWNDLTAYFIPIHDFPRQSWNEHRQLPLWNPLRNGGSPHLGNPQSALFYPANWLCWWADSANVLSWSLVLHHWFAGMGTYLLCRRVGLHWVASVAGGSIFLAAPYLVAHSGEGHYAQVCAVSWMPWTMLAFESNWRHGWPATIPLSLALALGFLAGHIQEWFYLCFVLSLWVVVHAVLTWRTTSVRAMFGVLVQWIVVALICMALVAVDLVPVLSYAGQTSRVGGLLGEEAGAIGMGCCNLLQLWNPFAMGGPNSYGGADKFFWETLCSFGIPPLVLAAVGAAAAWRGAVVRLIVCTTVPLFLYAFGSGSLVYAVLFEVVPGLNRFRAPARMLFLCSLAVAVLAAFGVDALWKSGRDRSERYLRVVRYALLGLCVASIAAALIVRSNGWREPAGPSGIADVGPWGLRPLVAKAVERSIGGAGNSAWLVASCLLACLALWRERWSRVAACVICLLGVTQLVLYAGDMLGTRSLHELRATRSLCRTLAREPGLFRALAPHSSLSALEAQSAGVAMLQGYDPVPLARYAVFMAALTGKEDPASVIAGDSSPHLDQIREGLLDLANVRFVAQQSGRAQSIPGEFNWRRMQLEDEPDDSDAVFENSDALPRAFVVGQTRVLPKSADVVAALAELRPREEALMPIEYLPPGTRAGFAAARIVEYTPNRVVVEADLAGTGYLMLSDSWYPGWTATDNGKRTSVMPGDYAFRAIPLGPGVHRVEFRYLPVGLVGAVAASVMAWFSSVAIWLGSRLGFSLRNFRVAFRRGQNGAGRG